MKTRDLLLKKISEGEELLHEVSTMRETDGFALNVVYYVKDDVEKCRGKINVWQFTTKEILIKTYGEVHRYVCSFLDTISKKNTGFDYRREFQFEVNRGIEVLKSIVESIELAIEEEMPMKLADIEKKKVFIVHGHAEAVNTEVARTIEKLGLEPIILRERPNSGFTIIEKFESTARGVGFAVILLTADDKVEGEDGFRARQNVVFEMGFFMGALGRKNVMCLLQDGVELPGDIDGVVYTVIDKAGHWRFALVKELKACGYTVDANKIL